MPLETTYPKNENDLFVFTMDVPLKGPSHNTAKLGSLLLFVVPLNLVSREKINSPQISRIKARLYPFFCFLYAFLPH